MDLIKLSKEKKFLSKDRLITVREEHYYLWMCELQKWLREKHKKFVSVELYGNSFCQHYTPYILENLNPNRRIEYSEFNTYEEALEQGLLEALKLIK